jgi:hypothetical protein
MHATFPVHLILIDLLVILHPSLIQIFTSSPCSQTLSVAVHYLIAGTKFYHHTKLQENLIVLCILIFTFLNNRQENERFWTEW